MGPAVLALVVMVAESSSSCAWTAATPSSRPQPHAWTTTEEAAELARACAHGRGLGEREWLPAGAECVALALAGARDGPALGLAGVEGGSTTPRKSWPSGARASTVTDRVDGSTTYTASREDVYSVSIGPVTPGTRPVSYRAAIV